MSNQVEPGTYVAKPIDWGLSKTTKKGTPYIFVRFSFFDEKNQTTHAMDWNGWLSEAAIKRTIQTLVKCGLQGDPDKIVEGPSGRALDVSKEVEIVVEMEPSLNDPSKSFPRIRWVNAIGEGKEATSPEEAKKTLDAVNFKAEVEAVKAESKTPDDSAPPPQLDESEALPF